MPSARVRYLLFDVESVADGELLSKVEYPGDSLSPQEAIDHCRQQQLEKTGREFIPYTFQIPVAVAIAKVAEDLSLIDLRTLDEPDYRPHVITKDFWSGWRHYSHEAARKSRNLTLVSFNGRTFDIPLLELAAFRYGLDIGDWMRDSGPSYEHPRNRYNSSSHIDLQEVVTNFGATRFKGGLNLLASLLKKPGKMGIAGHMVQDLHAEGQLNRINDYCRCDVLDTYFVFLRARLLYGEITLEQETKLVAETIQWLKQNSAVDPVYKEYLDNCEQWINPWTT